MKRLAIVLMSATLLAPAVAVAQQSNPAPRPAPGKAPQRYYPKQFCYFGNQPFTRGAALKMGGGVRVCENVGNSYNDVKLEWVPASQQ